MKYLKLTKDIENPASDKRQKYDWRRLQSFKKGDCFQVQSVNILNDIIDGKKVYKDIEEITKCGACRLDTLTNTMDASLVALKKHIEENSEIVETLPIHIRVKEVVQKAGSLEFFINSLLNHGVSIETIEKVAGDWRNN